MTKYKEKWSEKNKQKTRLFRSNGSKRCLTGNNQAKNRYNFNFPAMDTKCEQCWGYCMADKRQRDDKLTNVLSLSLDWGTHFLVTEFDKRGPLFDSIEWLVNTHYVFHIHCIHRMLHTMLQWILLESSFFCHFWMPKIPQVTKMSFWPCIQKKSWTLAIKRRWIFWLRPFPAKLFHFKHTLWSVDSVY